MINDSSISGCLTILKAPEFQSYELFYNFWNGKIKNTIHFRKLSALNSDFHISTPF